jgi:hypothetical protein
MRKHLLEEDNYCNFRASGRLATNLVDAIAVEIPTEITARNGD